MPRGEKRAGGRPPKSPNEVRQTLNCRVKPSTNEKISAFKEQTGCSIGELVDLAVEVLQKHPDELPPAVVEEESGEKGSGTGDVLGTGTAH